jgi:YesN/AraC family two-component response regulator
LTLPDLIEQRKLYASQKLLLQTNLTLEEISLKVGYKNPSSLNRLFKKYINTTPVNYKKQVLNSNNPKI